MVVILNADVLLPADFLRRLTYHYENGADYVLVDASVANRQFLFPRYVHCVSEIFYSRAVDCNFANMDWTEGFSCRRETALKAGLFPTGFPVPIGAGEDGFLAGACAGSGLKKLSI